MKTAKFAKKYKIIRQMQKYKTAIKLSFAFIVIASKALACAADVSGANFLLSSMIQQQAGGFLFFCSTNITINAETGIAAKIKRQNNEDKILKLKPQQLAGNICLTKIGVGSAYSNCYKICKCTVENGKKFRKNTQLAIFAFADVSFQFISALTANNWLRKKLLK